MLSLCNVQAGHIIVMHIQGGGSYGFCFDILHRKCERIFVYVKVSNFISLFLFQYKTFIECYAPFLSTFPNSNDNLNERPRTLSQNFYQKI